MLGRKEEAPEESDLNTGGGASVAALRELPGLNMHPGACGDAKWPLVSTGCSEVQINYRLAACESNPRLFFPSGLALFPFKRLNKTRQTTAWMLLFHSYIEAKPFFLCYLQLLFCFRDP